MNTQTHESQVSPVAPERHSGSPAPRLLTPEAGLCQPLEQRPDKAPEALVLTVEEAAAVLKVHPKTIRRLLARRFLTACRVLRKKLIPRQQIEAFLKATCDPPKSSV